MQINAENSTTAGIAQLPVFAGFNHPDAADLKRAIHAFMFCSNAIKLGTTSV
jgi:hypothetical protein